MSSAADLVASPGSWSNVEPVAATRTASSLVASVEVGDVDRGLDQQAQAQDDDRVIDAVNDQVEAVEAVADIAVVAEHGPPRVRVERRGSLRLR